jgi:hypothetical protein
MSLADWAKLQKAIGASGFWSLDCDCDSIGGFDGAQWLIEGRHGSIFHAVHRWSPGGAFQELGRRFFALAGPPLVGINPY